MTDIDQLFATLTEAQASKRQPPVHLWQPERSGSIDIRIDAGGQWYHEGGRIQRQPLVDLFAGILRREDDGFYLVTPVEKLKIDVEDAPFVAVDLDVRGSGSEAELLFTTNVGDYVLADASHPLTVRAGRPYLEVRDGLEALLARPVYYRLVEQALEEGGRLAVYSAGIRFDLGASV